MAIFWLNHEYLIDGLRVQDPSLEHVQITYSWKELQKCHNYENVKNIISENEIIFFYLNIV